MGNRVKESIAMMMIGDGVLGIAHPKEHCLVWLRGPKSWRRTVRWFVQHPTDKAKEHYRKLTNGVYAEQSKYTLILAAMGDRDVVEWAKKTLQTPGKKQWVRFYVLARSPLMEADDEVEGILRLRQRQIDPVIWLVQGYGESKSPFRLKRVLQITEREDKPKKLIFWLRQTLMSDGFRDDPAAIKALGKLPVVESERE